MEGHLRWAGGVFVIQGDSRSWRSDGILCKNSPKTVALACLEPGSGLIKGWRVDPSMFRQDADTGRISREDRACRLRFRHRVVEFSTVFAVFVTISRRSRLGSVRAERGYRQDPLAFLLKAAGPASGEKACCIFDH